MGIRVIQFAPSQGQQGRQPCTVVRRDFVLSPGDLEMEINLDKQVIEINWYTNVIELSRFYFSYSTAVSPWRPYCGECRHSESQQ
jgi:hypothetical protein